MTDMKLNELLDDEELIEMFRERAQTEAQRIFSDTARDVMRVHAKKIAESAIEMVVADALAGEVKMDDGWGKKETYASLQDMFKSYLHHEMQGYSLTKALDREVSRQVKALIDANAKALAAKLVEEVVVKSEGAGV